MGRSSSSPNRRPSLRALMVLRCVNRAGATSSDGSKNTSPRRGRRMPRQKPDLDRIFHALGDPTRRAIVERLSRGPASVSYLAMPLGITLAAVVQHLQILEASGLVTTEKLGRVRTCSIEPAGLSLAEKWIN